MDSLKLFNYMLLFIVMLNIGFLNIVFSAITINFVQPTPASDNLNDIPIVNVSAITDNGVISSIEAYVNNNLVKRCLNTNTCYVLPDETGVNIVSAGFINYKFTAITTAGESKNISKSFFIDKVGPDIKFNAPTPNENAVVNGTIIISAEGKDNSAGTGIDNVSIFIDGNLLSECSNSDPFAPPSLSCNATINSNQYNDGNHTISVIAYDIVGNAGIKTRTLNFDNNIPFITFSPPTPLNNSAFNRGTIIIINATSNSEDLESIDIFIDNNIVYSCNSLTCSYSWDTSTENIGGHNFYAEARDRYGNINRTETRLVTLNVNSGGGGGGGSSGTGGSNAGSGNNGSNRMMLIVTNKLCPDNKIQFKVKDINGTAIESAEIRVTKNGSIIPDTLLTNYEGIAYYTIKDNATYSITVNANNYNSKTFDLSVSLCGLEEKNETIGEFAKANETKENITITNETEEKSNVTNTKNETNALSGIKNETKNEQKEESKVNEAGSSNIGSGGSGGGFINFSAIGETLKTLAVFAVPIAVLFIARALFRRFIMP